jgi:phage portal protein BeeE
MMIETLRSLLRAPEKKASRVAQLVAVESGGRARGTPRDYAALAREGYMRNAIAYRAVKLIAESAGALSILLY